MSYTAELIAVGSPKKAQPFGDPSFSPELAEVNPASSKVLAPGQNAWTA